MKKIIRITGEATDITYQDASLICITLKYRSVYVKLFDEPEYQLVENMERDRSKLVEIPYSGARSLSKDEECAMRFPEEVELGSCGYGAPTNDIHRTNRITVYALCHNVGRFEQAETYVLDKIIVINHVARIEQFGSLVERIASTIHPQQ